MGALPLTQHGTASPCAVVCAEGPDLPVPPSSRVLLENAAGSTGDPQTHEQAGTVLGHQEPRSQPSGAAGHGPAESLRDNPSPRYTARPFRLPPLPQRSIRGCTTRCCLGARRGAERRPPGRGKRRAQRGVRRRPTSEPTEQQPASAPGWERRSPRGAGAGDQPCPPPRTRGSQQRGAGRDERIQRDLDRLES